MAAAIGALHADIGANSAAFAADMGKAERALKSGSAKMNRSLGRLDKGFLKVRKGIAAKVKSLFSLKGAIIGVVGGGGLGLLIKRALDTGDTIAKVADSIGVSTDFLQEYRFAAGLAGVETGNFDSALQAFAKRVGEAKAGTGTLITILKKMDPALLAAVQGAESMDTAFDLIIKKGASLTSQLDRAALFAAAFGRTAGVEMTNLIRNGSDEIDRMRQRARDLGLVMREDLLRGAEEAKDRLSELGQVLSTKVTAAILANADAIADLAERFTAATPKILAAGRAFGEFLGLIEPSRVAILKGIVAEIRELEAFLENPTPETGVLGFFRDLGEAGRVKRATDRVAELRVEMARLQLEIFRAGESSAGPVKAAAAAETFNDSLSRVAETMAAISKTNYERALGLQQLDQANLKWAELNRQMIRPNIQLDQAAKKWAVLKVEIDKNVKATDKVSFAAEAMGDSVGRNLQSIINRSTTAAGAVRNLAFELGNAVLRESVINPISSRASGFFKNLLKFQHGGTVTAGGSGGPDSQIFGPVRVSPREKITFTPPGQAPRGGGTTIVNNNYNIYAPGADAGAVQRIEAVLVNHIRSTPAIALAAVNNARHRGG